MKNIFFLFLLSGFVFATFSCNDDIPQTLQGEYIAIDGSKTNISILRLNDGIPKDPGIKTTLIAVAKSSPVNYTYSILPSSTAQEGVHYMVGSTSGTIPANEYTGTLPISILADNINPGEVWSLDIKLTSADLTLARQDSTSFKISVTCLSDIGGTFDFVSTELSAITGSCPTDPISGTVTWTEVEEGVYSTTDLGFGQYESSCWNDDPATSVNARILETCEVLSTSGGDQYGLIYTYTIVSTNGPVMEMTWVNDYDDSGRVVLTRQDGKDWPDLKTN